MPPTTARAIGALAELALQLEQVQRDVRGADLQLPAADPQDAGARRRDAGQRPGPVHEPALPAHEPEGPRRDYWRMARAWFWLGVPAFVAMMLVVALMVFKHIPGVAS